jgi:hypothetical protein
LPQNRWKGGEGLIGFRGKAGRDEPAFEWGHVFLVKITGRIICR